MRSLNPRSTLALVTVLFLLYLGFSGCRDNPVDASEVDASEDVAARSAAGGVEGLNEIAGVEVPFADAEVFFEFNATDNDLGLQVFLDAEGWRKVTVSNEEIGRIIRLETVGLLSQLGITELHFERAEPTPEEVMALFPPGMYRFGGRTLGGDRLEGEGELSHDLVAAFDFTPSDGEEVDPDSAVVEWAAPGAKLVEIIIESEDSDTVFDVTVEGEEGDLDIPSQFLTPNTEYEIELVAIAENGNKTIVESTFITGEGDEDEAEADDEEEDDDDDDDEDDG